MFVLVDFLPYEASRVDSANKFSGGDVSRDSFNPFLESEEIYVDHKLGKVTDDFRFPADNGVLVAIVFGYGIAFVDEEDRKDAVLWVSGDNVFEVTVARVR